MQVDRSLCSFSVVCQEESIKLVQVSEVCCTVSRNKGSWVGLQENVKLPSMKVSSVIEGLSSKNSVILQL